jgi:hypothetical protein
MRIVKEMANTESSTLDLALSELAEKGADADLLRVVIQFVAQRMMEMDVESLCAAAYGERRAPSG